MSAALSKRTDAFTAIARLQPGCTPYENRRPFPVQRRSDGLTLREHLGPIMPYIEQPELIDTHHEAGRILVDQRQVPLDRRLAAGNIVTVITPQQTEPAIAPDIIVIHEDDALIVLKKPAPLPVHPSGRFNRNTIISIGRQAWPDIDLKPVHRLDARTTGALVLAKHAKAARHMMHCFTRREVRKTYHARVHGHVEEEQLTISTPIDKKPFIAGTRALSPDGQEAVTHVTALAHLQDQTTLVEVRPETGRTNQIRLHLQSIGHPIVGDVAYGRGYITQGDDRLDDTPLYLNATRISFAHPETLLTCEFNAPEPDYFRTERAPKPRHY